MAKPRFTVRQLLLGTVYVATIIAVSQSWRSSGALAAPSVFYVGLLFAGAFFALRRYALPRFLFPHALGLSFAALTLILSLGPACFLMTRFHINHKTYPRITEGFNYIYHPIANSILFAPEPIRSVSISYVSWWFPGKTPLIDTGWGLQWSIPSSWQRVQRNDSRPLRLAAENNADSHRLSSSPVGRRFRNSRVNPLVSAESYRWLNRTVG